MKKIFIILVILSLYISYQLFAQCPDCDGTGGRCTEWGAPPTGSYSFQPFPGDICYEMGGFYKDGIYCWFDIAFQVRTCYCPELRREIRINEIKLGPDCNPNDYHIIMQEAIRMLLNHMPNIFDIDPFPMDGWDVYIITEKCFQNIEFPINSGIYKITRCENDLCCKTYYSVRNNINNFSLNEKEKIQHPSTLCNYPCYDICNSNDYALGNLWTSNFFDPYCSNIQPCSNLVWNDQIVIFNNEIFEKRFVRTFDVTKKASYYVATATCPDNDNDGRTENYITIKRIRLTPDLGNDSEIPIGLIMCEGIRGALFRANGYFRELLDQNNPREEGLTYNIILPKCWQKINNNQWLVPYTPTSCCSATARLRYVTPPNCEAPYPYCKKVLSIENVFTPQIVCEGLYADNACNIFIYPNCLVAGFLPKEVNDNYEISPSLNETIVEFKPNPIKDYMDFSILSPIDGDIEISITNINGLELLNRKYKKNYLEFSFRFECKLPSVGMYIIRVKLNNEIISYNKFIYYD